MSSKNVFALNVGGQHYLTTLETLNQVSNSKLALWFKSNTVSNLATDQKGRYVIDRDGSLFRHVLNYLRNKSLILPENFAEWEQLRLEAEYYGLEAMASALKCQAPSARSAERVPQPPNVPQSSSSSTSKSGSLTLVPPLSLSGAASPGGGGGSTSSAAAGAESCSPSSPSPNYFGGYGIPKGAGGPGYITVGYRGSFAFGRDGLADVKFRKFTKILVSGRVAICREVFGDTLNESRDPDHCDDDNRYTARFFLKHLMLEQAFDCLQESGFRCVGSCGSGTASMPANEPQKPGIESEETRWNHYNEFVFCRP